jgi:hypothetical protein
MSASMFERMALNSFFCSHVLPLFVAMCVPPSRNALCQHSWRKVCGFLHVSALWGFQCSWVRSRSAATAEQSAPGRRGHVHTDCALGVFWLCLHVRWASVVFCRSRAMGVHFHAIHASLSLTCLAHRSTRASPTSVLCSWIQAALFVSVPRAFHCFFAWGLGAIAFVDAS